VWQIGPKTPSSGKHNECPACTVVPLRTSFHDSASCDCPWEPVPLTDREIYRGYESGLASGKLSAWQRNVQRPIKRSGRLTIWRRSPSVVLNSEQAGEKHTSTSAEPLNQIGNPAQETWDKNSSGIAFFCLAEVGKSAESQNVGCQSVREIWFRIPTL
jgi:hypothetical protein